MNWSRPPELRAQLHKLWDKGILLASMVPSVHPVNALQQPVLFPLKLALAGPTSTQMVDNFNEVRAWSRELRAEPHIRLKLREFKHRQLGINMVPYEAWVNTLDDALAWLGHEKEVQNFALLCGQTQEHQPQLLDWLRLHSLQALALAGVWGRLVQIVQWLQQHPRPGIYLRQLDIAGVGQSFLQTHRAVLCELLDAALPAFAIDRGAAAPEGFVQRYGFVETPRLIRFRLLDPWSRLAAGPLNHACDITLDAASFARLNAAPSRVFICTGESNFLAFPALRNALVVYCHTPSALELFHSLGQTPWLHDSPVYFWGDIDVAGFSILAALRHQLKQTQSLLMDRATLLALENHWGQGAAHKGIAQSSTGLSFLTNSERNLHDELQGDRLRKNLRLSQEEIPWERVLAALAALEFQSP